MIHSDYLEEERRYGWSHKEDLESWLTRMRRLKAELRRKETDSVRENLRVKFPKYGERPVVSPR